ncbi:hypothetical protein JOB18_033213 [Solea senegalensis]|uniref:Uncharacterized protein n=1 Tax=Solea senegalensis TaxID=28829 RepID=A0AAV6S5P1_SOLSE|nr:hypothetical protein JOB18_033213 [Solea senegalensis]
MLTEDYLCFFKKFRRENVRTFPNTYELFITDVDSPFPDVHQRRTKAGDRSRRRINRRKEPPTDSRRR